MKATDLMIGDWGYIKPLTGFIYTQRKIGTQDFIKLHKMETVPIPLTPEILEKNGLKKRNNYQWIYRDNICKIVVSIAPQIEIGGKSLGMPPVNIMLEGASFNVNITFDGFVHELQHALRLCGIKKEIIF